MNEVTAKALLLAALDMFFDRDADLPGDVGERCVAHRLAVYMEEWLRSADYQWSVDCEYNRMGVDPKRLRGLVARQRRDGGEREGLAVPDIIVHRRGPTGPNLLAIEVKRADNSALDDDREKLRLYKQEQGYQHAFLLLIAGRRDHCRIEVI